MENCKSHALLAALLVLSAVYASGCAEQIPANFDAREAQYVLGEGDNTIAGRVALVSRSGYVRTCIDSNVRLIPVTAYSREWVSRIFGSPPAEYGSRVIEEHIADNEQFEKFQRRADCDKAGDFRFDHVADGQYYVFATIYWLNRWQHNGGALLRQVTISRGRTVNITLEHHSG